TVVANSRKFSNATFEEITHLVREIVALAETCCADGADPSCYDAGSSALSAKSCGEGSSFPAHPGTAACCAQEGLEQKLCLAALRHPPQPLPRYLQPSDEELCQAFRQDPKDFADRAPSNTSVPSAPKALSNPSSPSLLSNPRTPSKPCAPNKPSVPSNPSALSNTRVPRTPSNTPAPGNRRTPSFHSLASLAQKVPGAAFEDLLPLAEDAAEVFAQCCDSLAEDCVRQKLSEHTARACGVLAVRDGRFAECCRGKDPPQDYFCITALPPAPAPALPAPQQPTDEQLCGEEGARHAKRYLFEVARRHPSVPDALLGKLYDASERARGECCPAQDPSACLGDKRRRMAEELPPVLQRASQLCGQYNELSFLDFKKR
ncbi:VTDB protein, partial [Nyctibius grandis]|nr:VTDB protein [Nyctibius grandis]